MASIARIAGFLVTSNRRLARSICAMPDPYYWRLPDQSLATHPDPPQCCCFCDDACHRKYRDCAKRCSDCDDNTVRGHRGDQGFYQ